MDYNVYDNWERLVKKVLHEEKLRHEAFREFSGFSVSSSSSSSSSSFRQEGYRKPENIISEGHKNYDLMRSLQLGIRLSITRFPSLPVREVRASDFDPKLKLWHRFPPDGSKYMPLHQSAEFLWKDYCPMVFRNLREMFNLDLMDDLLSICGNDALREISSLGKSGSFFYLTPDDKFMIKRVRKSEIKVLLKILPFYYNHIQMFDSTLLTKFYGAYSYKQVGGMKARFVVTDNLFYSKYQIHRRFDLERSSYGRSCDGEGDETTTLKDLDLQQIDLDCKFLEAQSIMDCSLVLGVHFCDDNNTDDNIMENIDSYQNEKSWDGYNFPETEQQYMDRVLVGRASSTMQPTINGGGDACYIYMPALRIKGKLSKLLNSLSDYLNFRVHSQLRIAKEKCYEPEIIPIGPYHRYSYDCHRDNKMKAMMEERKWHYLQSLFKRRSESVEKYIKAMRDLEEKTRKYYNELPQELMNSQEFVEMMLLDGCFIVELFKKANNHSLIDDTDPIFGMVWLRNALERDLMLFENQIPFFVLYKLFELSSDDDDNDDLIQLAVTFFLPLIPGDGHLAANSDEIDWSGKTKNLLELIYQNWLSPFAGTKIGVHDERETKK